MRAAGGAATQVLPPHGSPLSQLSRDPETGKLVLDDPYSEELKATPLVVDTHNPMMPVEGPKRTAYD